MYGEFDIIKESGVGSFLKRTMTRAERMLSKMKMKKRYVAELNPKKGKVVYKKVAPEVEMRGFLDPRTGKIKFKHVAKGSAPPNASATTKIEKEINEAASKAESTAAKTTAPETAVEKKKRRIPFKYIAGGVLGLAGLGAGTYYATRPRRRQSIYTY